MPVGAMPWSRRSQTSGIAGHGWHWHSSFAMECLQAADTDLERGLPGVGHIHPLLENFSKWPELGFVSQSMGDELLLATRLEVLLGIPREACSLHPCLPTSCHPQAFFRDGRRDAGEGTGCGSWHHH